MKIKLNDEAVLLNERLTLWALLDRTFGEQAGMAVAINGDVVPRGHWEAHLLSDGDSVDVFHAVAGG